MTILRLVIFTGISIGGIALFLRIAPAKSKLLVMRNEPHFPIVSGFNLNREEFELPRDFEGDFNLIIVAFKQYQQQLVDTWIPTAQSLEAAVSGFVYYELPTIYEMPVLSRTFINEGMRAGIPDQTARERTITLYLDKTAFKSALGIINEDDIYLFLVNREGDILWRTNGSYSQTKADDLLDFLKDQQNHD